MSNICNEMVETRNGLKCCNAKWRVNYPFGKNSRGKTTMIREHQKGCKFKKEDKRRRGRR